MAVINLIQITLLSIFYLIIFVKQKDKLITNQKTVSLTIPFLLTFLIILLSYLYIGLHQIDNLQYLYRGRDVTTKQVPLDVFLTYCRELIGYEKFIDLLKSRYIEHYANNIQVNNQVAHHFDITLYIGLIPIPFIIYALIKPLKSRELILCALVIVFLFTYYRNDTVLYIGIIAMPFVFYSFWRLSGINEPIYWALIAVIVVVALFSLGGSFSKMMYYTFPGMKYYRHIGHAVASFKIYFPLLAGFGLIYFLENHSKNQKLLLIIRFAIPLILCAEAIMYYYFAATTAAKYVAITYAIIAIILLAYSALVNKIFNGNSLVLFLIIALSIEMIAYQSMIAAGFSGIANANSQFAQASKPEFKNIRTHKPMDKNTEENLIFLNKLKKCCGEVYTASSYYFMQWDPCETAYRTDFIDKRVAELLEVKGAIVKPYRFKLPQDSDLKEALGCMSPKLKLITNVIFTENEADALKEVGKSDKISKSVVLNNVSPKTIGKWENYPESKGNMKVTGFSANKLEVVADVPEEYGAWLYYADAYRPEWKSYINGTETQVIQANYAFKAVRLKQGINKIEFVYDHRIMKFAFYVLIITGVLFVFCLFVMFTDFHGN